MIGLALWSRHRPADPKTTGPADRITAMLDAAGRGDVGEYLACFAGDLREQNEARSTEKPREFAELIRAGAVDLVGIVTAPIRIDADRAEFLLERVRREYVERQTVTLRVIAGDWRIVGLSPVERHVPEFRYGTAATILPPQRLPGATPTVR
jgi:hypothetical protein